ncbi:hypothetical protein N7495_010009 [Penicillium taxi]|uniref:uncharacterized protein n=1 Tax=Penicillium taxi TaxID=168475 RepID=UPI002545085E|nr:uncharacterized protein N7495_010009 [Penicillium taxi]KAJ5885499.1 hypothetical protein N7495_010009 [Penicillium taxi]
MEKDRVTESMDYSFLMSPENFTIHEGQAHKLQTEVDYIASYKTILDESGLDDAAYWNQIAPYTTKMRTSSSTLRVLKRQNGLLADDLAEAAIPKKQPRLSEPPDQSLLERVYKDTIMSRIMASSGRQRAVWSKKDKQNFKEEVEEYYEVRKKYPALSFCNVLGDFFEPKMIKAAHIVPKAMSRAELGHRFGDQDAILHDSGDLAIIPMAGETTLPTSWRCVMMNPEKRRNIVLGGGDKARDILLQDLDGKELRFLGLNRPRRRYLYLRFIISYLWMKRKSWDDLAKNLDEETRRQLAEMLEALKVEVRKFWPSEGDYLNRSTLKTLARCVSGSEIPGDLIASSTFEDSSDPVRNCEAGMIIAADIGDEPRGPAKLNFWLP